ncbi:MAG: ROK family protein [Candidatus Aminicenantes bacterium]|nr:MAG: ROK family protein [Candidatus Aminicenantes bacterium]
MTSAYDAGFDIGGTRLKFGLVDGDGRLVHKGRVRSPEAMTEILAVLEESWAGLKKKAPGPIRSCGFGIAGFYSIKERKILQSPNYPSLNGYPLIPALRKFIDVPIRIGNDANMAAYGEFRHGAGRGARSLVLLTVGTGIGSGVILDGKLWQGEGGYAGEIGHITVNPEGEACGCGNRGCLETEASAPRMVRNFQALTGRTDITDSRDIYLLAKAGDPAALESFRTLAYWLGIGIGIVINMLNPEMVLIGGGVVSAGKLLLGPVAEEARRRSHRISFAGCRIEKAALGNDAGLVGAAAWAHLKSGRRG